MKATDNISELLERIKSFKIVKCNMHHEKVATNVDQKPIYKVLDDAVVFDRAHLCNIKDRNLRLGCAHSGVNLNFERLLESVATELPEISHHISDIKNEFNTVISNIYALDHRVGHLEHDLALCQLNSNKRQRETLMSSMTILKSEHRTYMDQLQNIKSDIEQLIKMELNYTSL